jgi:hypothetical protein
LSGKYVYCISDLPGELGGIGLFDKPVGFVNYNGIVAFVSEVQAEKVSLDIETISAHQRVVEASRKFSTTLPVKFGVIFNTEAAVKKMLASSFDEYKSKLASFRGKDEFGVKVLETSENEKSKSDVKKEKGTSHRSKTGTEYLLKLKRDEAARIDRLRSRERLKEDVDAELVGVVEASTSLRADLPQIVVNAAYLVAKPRQDAFSSKIELLRTKLAEKGFLIHVSGPWAPYSFC